MSIGTHGGAPGLHGTCANHPDAPVSALCNRCGDFICDACIELKPSGEIYCPNCRNDYVRLSAGPLEWESRDEHGVIGGFLLTVKSSLLSPTTFFSKVEPGGSYWEPLAYATVCWMFSLFVAVMQQVVVFFIEPPGQEGTREVFKMIWSDLFQGNQAVAIGAGVGFLFALVASIPLWALIRASLFHLCVMVVGANNEGFRATWRLSNYTSGVQLIGALIGLMVILLGVWNPIAYLVLSILAGLAGLFVFMYDLVLVGFGIRDVHGATTGQTVGALVVYIVSMVLLCCGIYLAILIPMIALMPGLM